MYNSSFIIWNWNTKRITWIKPYNLAMERVTVFVHLFGVICNIPVLIIFFKDGFASSANICFFSLAIVDLFICAFHTVWRAWSICYAMGIAKEYRSLLNLEQFAAPSSDAMNCVSSWITALITLERLLCILFPLKVRSIITQKVTTCIILGFLVFQISALVIPGTLTYNSYTAYFDTDNITRKHFGDQLLRRYIFFSEIHQYIKLITTYIFNMALYGIIIIETILLIFFFKLNMKSRTFLVGKKKERNSAKEKRLVKSVIGVCVFFIITSCPRNMEQLYAVWPGALMTLNRHIQVLFPLLYGLYPLLDGVNHSFNLFVYLAVNSRFRQNFLDLFTSRRAQKSIGSK